MSILYQIQYIKVKSNLITISLIFCIKFSETKNRFIKIRVSDPIIRLLKLSSDVI